MKHLISGLLITAVLLGVVVARNTIKFTYDNTSGTASAHTEVARADAQPASAEAAAPVRQPVANEAAPELASIATPPQPAAAASPDEQQKKPQPYSIIINLPAYRLRLFENGKLIKMYPVCIGMPGHRSPVRKMEIKSVMWNPSWGPPPDAAWAAHSSGKGPGKFNPVGVVKMPLRGYVFVHGTYKIKSLGFAWSHGCIRMANEDASELAWFLQTHVGSNHPEHKLEDYQRSRRTTTVWLNAPVPVESIYETIEVYDGKLYVHPDVYKMGTNSMERAFEAVKNAGWPGDKADAMLIKRMIERSRKETAIARKAEIVGQGN